MGFYICMSTSRLEAQYKPSVLDCQTDKLPQCIGARGRNLGRHPKRHYHPLVVAFRVTQLTNNPIELCEYFSFKKSSNMRRNKGQV